MKPSELNANLPLHDSLVDLISQEPETISFLTELCETEEGAPPERGKLLFRGVDQLVLDPPLKGNIIYDSSDQKSSAHILDMRTSCANVVPYEQVEIIVQIDQYDTRSNNLLILRFTAREALWMEFNAYTSAAEEDR